MLTNDNREFVTNEGCEHFSRDLRDAHIFAVEPSHDLGLRIVEVTVTITRGEP